MENKESLVIAVKDELTGTFFQPNYFKGEKAKEQALRLFESQVNNNQLWKDNPNDFGLYKLGYFNEEKGITFNDCDGPEKLASGGSVLRKE